MGLSHPQKYTAFAHYICVQDNMFQLKSDHLCRLLCKNSHTVVGLLLILRVIFNVWFVASLLDWVETHSPSDVANKYPRLYLPIMPIPT